MGVTESDATWRLNNENNNEPSWGLLSPVLQMETGVEAQREAAPAPGSETQEWRLQFAIQVQLGSFLTKHFFFKVVFTSSFLWFHVKGPWLLEHQGVGDQGIILLLSKSHNRECHPGGVADPCRSRQEVGEQQWQWNWPNAELVFQGG